MRQAFGSLRSTDVAASIPLPEGQWLDVDGIRTRYHAAGDGAPIVFIYGGNFGTADSTSSCYTWNLNMTPLADHFRVVALDKLGQGYTDNPAVDSDYTMSAVVAHAARFIQLMNLPPVHLVGHSRGGYAAARLTLLHPDLVNSLTIVNSGTLSAGVGTNEVVLGGCPHPKGTPESVRWVYENYSYSPSVVTDEWVAEVMKVLQLEKHSVAVKKMSAEKLGASLFLPSLAGEKRETLQWIDDGRLQRPTQVIWGLNDRTAHLARGVDLYKRIARHDRHALFHCFNESGHFPFREHPAQFNAALASFVRLHS